MIAVAAAIAASLAAGVAVERRWGGAAHRLARAVLAAVLYGLLPFVNFFILARFEVTLEVGGGIVLAWIALALTGGAAWLVSRRALGLSRPETGSVMLASIVANTGYLGLPLTVALLGHEHLAEALVYDVLVGGPALWIAGFAVAAAFGEKAGEGVGERTRTFLLRNPILAAVIAGLLAPDALAPDFLVEASRTAVLAILPLGFFAAGTLLAEEAEEGALPLPPPVDGAIAAAVGLRLVLTPALLAGLAAPLLDLPRAYLLLAAMPCAINALAVTHAYGLRLRTVAASIAWGSGLVIAAALAAVALP